MLAKGNSTGEEQGAGRVVSTMHSVMHLQEHGKEAEGTGKHTSPGSQRRLHLHQGSAAAWLGFAGPTNYLTGFVICCRLCLTMSPLEVSPAVEEQVSLATICVPCKPTVRTDCDPKAVDGCVVGRTLNTLLQVPCRL